MSLVELTRNSFQSGVSAAKWVKLCRLLISKEYPNNGHTDTGAVLSNSVLLLFRLYPGDPTLQGYLICAIQEKLIPIATFVATFLQAARSPELHNPATLDMLCRVALDAHYSSGVSPIGSVVPYSESPIIVLGTVQDALALLRTAHTLPMSHYHQLTISASELVILLLSCVTDMSQISTAQAMVHFSDANDMLQSLRLTPDVRQVLDSFVLSLSLLIGDDAKAAREAQMMHAIQLALSKDILGPNSDTDIVTCSLMFHHFLFCRASEFGAGNGPHVVAMLVRTLRSTSWTPQVFYTQLLISAVTCVSQYCAAGFEGRSALIWRAFVIARLPRILVLFEGAIESENVADADWRSATQYALTSLFQGTNILANCDDIQFHMGSLDSMNDGIDMPQSFSHDLLQQLVELGFIDMPFATTVHPGFSSFHSPRLHLEVQDSGVSMEHYIEMKLSTDTNQDDAHAFIERMRRDPSSHAAFAEVVLKRFVSLAGAFEAEGLSQLSKILYLHAFALDLVSLHIKIYDLLAHALAFLEDYDCETVGDPQTAVSHLGDVVLFVQSTLAHFHITAKEFAIGNRRLRLDFLSAITAHRVDHVSEKDMGSFNAWFKALFDSSSEGIEDTILRSTRPKTLLRLAPRLFSHAISAYSEKQIDKDVLNNGVSYFLGPLLNWTLVGVTQALLIEIQHKGPAAQTQLEVLQTLLLSPSCPLPVLNLCSASILRLISDPTVQNAGRPVGFDVAAIRRLATQALGLPEEAATQNPLSMGPHVPWMEQPRQAIRDALIMARSGKAPALDIDRCLVVLPPSKFLQLLWSELSVAANLGAMEACRRIATYALTMPRPSNTAPLMPTFLHIVLPSVILSIDQQQPGEQTVNLELIVSIISYALTASLHLEWALHTVCNEDRPVLGQSTAGMGRQLASDLRRMNSHTAGIIAHRLASSTSFVANFPMFITEI